ncbi:MAG: response regulator [Betaproteobacteria bacterium]|nr:MAG: response regulator [Betaproteobacteria bacterium]
MAQSDTSRSSRVLVVDDNPDAANSLATILRRSGHDVHIASDGHSAVQIAMRVRPQLVLLDIGLPGLDGFAVAKRLRQEFSLGGLKIIAVTGREAEGDRYRSIEAGIDQYLLKPVDPVFLESLLGKGSNRKDR